MDILRLSTGGTVTGGAPILSRVSPTVFTAAFLAFCSSRTVSLPNTLRGKMTVAKKETLKQSYYCAAGAHMNIKIRSGEGVIGTPLSIM